MFFGFWKIPRWALSTEVWGLYLDEILSTYPVQWGFVINFKPFKPWNVVNLSQPTSTNGTGSWMFCTWKQLMLLCPRAVDLLLFCWSLSCFWIKLGMEAVDSSRSCDLWHSFVCTGTVHQGSLQRSSRWIFLWIVPWDSSPSFSAIWENIFGSLQISELGFGVFQEISSLGSVCDLIVSQHPGCCGDPWVTLQGVSCSYVTPTSNPFKMTIFWGLTHLLN